MLVFLLQAFVTLAVSSAPSLQTTNDTLHLAYAAFCKEADVNAWSCKWCNEAPVTRTVSVLKYIHHWFAGTQGYVGVDLSSKRIIIAFRGSKNLANGIEDALFWETSFGPKDAKVEKGFYTAYDSVYKDAMQGINEGLERCPDCTLLWTGHSLGAAMATIGSIKYLHETNATRTSNTFTFGCPRVGNKEFVEYATSLLKKSGSTNVRVAREHDIVPSLPPQFIGYRHLAQEVWNRHNATSEWLQECSAENGEDPKCYDSEYNLSGAQHTMYLGFKGGWC